MAAAAPTTVPVSQVYTWEPSNPPLAARYGLRPEDILRFDLNTSPAARAGHRGSARGPVRPAPQRVPRQHVQRRGRRRGGVRGCRPIADPRGCRRGRGPGHHRQDVPARGRPSRRAHPDLRHVRRPDHAARRRPSMPSCAVPSARASASTWSGSCRVWRAPTSSGCAPPTTPPVRRSPSAPSSGSWTQRPSSAARDPSWSSTRPTPSSRRRRPCRSSTGTRGSSWCARCPRRSRWRACASATRSPSARPSSAWSGCGHPAASPPCPRRSRPPRCADRSRRAATPRSSSGSVPGWPSGWPTWDCRRIPASPTSCWCPSARWRRPRTSRTTLLRAGIVTRTFGPANPLRGHLRLTVRTRAENERLLGRAPDMAGREASMTTSSAHRGPGTDHPRDDHPRQRRPRRLGSLGDQHGRRLLRPPADLAGASLAHRHRHRRHRRPAHRRAPHRGGRGPGPG